MAITRLSDMIVVPEKFASYVEDRTVQKSLMVNSGIATADGTVAQLINGTPKGGRFIEIPAWNELRATRPYSAKPLLTRLALQQSHGPQPCRFGRKLGVRQTLQRYWAERTPMAAIANLIADWRNIHEQKIYLAIL